jgi:integrase
VHEGVSHNQRHRQSDQDDRFQPFGRVPSGRHAPSVHRHLSSRHPLGRRTITLDEETVEALERHRDAQLLERDLAGDAYEDGDLVFCNELGSPIHPQRLTEWFSKLRKAAGIPTGGLHVLRHTRSR